LFLLFIEADAERTSGIGAALNRDTYPEA
jgi:hypothetical protein